MARIRTIKPEFFVDEDVAALSPWAQLLFVALWTHADKAGRLEDRPARIKVCCQPYSTQNIDALLGELVSARFIHRYTTVSGRRLIQIRTWAKHQRPHHTEPESTYEPPPSDNGEATVFAPLSNGDAPDGKEGRGERNGREGEGRTLAPIVRSQRRNVAIPWRVPVPGDLWAEWRTRLAAEAHDGDEAAAERALHAWAMGLITDWGDKPTGGDDCYSFWRARFAEWRGTTKRSGALPAEPPAPRIPKAREVLAAQGIPLPARKVVAS